MISFKKKEEQKESSVVTNPEIAALLKKKKRKKRITIAVVLVAAVAIGAKLMMPKDISLPVSTYTVKLGDLENKISLGGTVRSENSRKIYNTVSDEVIKVNVKLGDKVKKGDVLAEISSESTSDAIAKQKAAMSISSQSNALRLYDAEKKLAQAKSDISVGTYEDIERMDDTVQSAAERLANARRAYKDVYNNLDIDRNEDEMRLKERSMVTARLDMEERAKELKKQGISPADDEEYLEKRSNYEKIREEWIRMYNLYIDGLSAQGNAVQSALLDYDNALRQQERLTINVGRNLEALENNVKSAQLAADETVDTITLKGLMTDLDDCKVTAPIDGIITAVYIKE
ncbi:MAG: efflux RND transporter periplasmic adaptor subunit, partial [Oscillospiraceae bacterium]